MTAEIVDILFSQLMSLKHLSRLTSRGDADPGQLNNSRPNAQFSHHEIQGDHKDEKGVQIVGGFIKKHSF